ncbi:phospholipase A [Tunicatimonas pelagia]|uniref:phospholipase A n=1 Tax=Tunicatimonas pelagia TaxID=931531 RepID=UPI002666F587|nr:phospholipase A [Tunicatimonas pelagia]WKN42600.1 phospholipase A [Tunicatimonas pelagia]
MAKRNFWLAFWIGWVGLPAFAQVSVDSAHFTEAFQQEPPFGIFKDNYFITGAPIGETPNRMNADAKFQISFKHRLIDRKLPFGTYLFLTYTQKSFWNIYQESSPFAETNYNPGLGLGKLQFRNGKLGGIALLQVEHESNGLPPESSRSWNSLSVNYLKFATDDLLVGLKAWLPFGYTKDNEDLMEYIGFQELTAHWRVANRLLFDVQLRKAAAWNNRGSLQAGMSYKIDSEANQYLYIQWWQGYAESLIEYEQVSSMLRLGIAIKPPFPDYY